MSRYHWIHFLSAGVESIWAMPFEKRGVLLTKSSGVHAAPMSEFAIGAMLHFTKRFDQFVAQSAERSWRRAWLDELTGRTLTILGMGHIGQMLAQRAGLFGMRVIGVQRTPRQVPHVEKTVGLGELDTVLGETDYLAVFLPLTEHTRGLVDGAFIRRLKPGAVLVDLSRGGIVCEAALLDALDAGHLRGAALDVFEREPLPVESRLWSRSDVLLTPHVAGTTPYYMSRAIEVFLANARRLAAGEGPLTAIDIEQRY